MATIARMIGKDGKARFAARVRVAGYPEQHATFARQADAKAWAAQREAEMRAGRYRSDAIAREKTAGDLINRYLESVLPYKSSKARYLRQQQRQLIWWRYEIGDFLLVHVTPFLLAEKRDALAASGRKAGTVNRYLAALGHALNTAKKEWGWLHENPMEAVRQPKEPRGRVRFLQRDELEALLAACRRCTRKPLYELVALAVATGARKGELLRLRWADVDLARARAVVQESKNNERRALHLGSHAQALLADLQRRRHPRNDFVFAARRAGFMDIEREWRRAMALAGIKDFRFHDLRHTAASYLAMNGASLADIAEALGHKTLSMVKRYAHLSETHTASVIAEMNATLFNSPPTQQQEAES